MANFFHSKVFWPSMGQFNMNQAIHNRQYTIYSTNQITLVSIDSIFVFDLATV